MTRIFHTSAEITPRSGALIAFGIGAFGIGLTEFAIMGVLPQVAADLGTSLPAAGLLISWYALGVTFGGPLLAILAGRLPHRTVLGLPFGTWLRQACGWRATFWVVVAVNLCALAAIALLVPRTAPGAPLSLSQLCGFARPAPLRALAMTVADTLILLIGTNDIAWPGSPFAPEDGPMQVSHLQAGLRQAAAKVHAQGMTLILGTVPPFKGALPDTPMGKPIGALKKMRCTAR